MIGRRRYVQPAVWGGRASGAARRQRFASSTVTQRPRTSKTLIQAEDGCDVLCTCSVRRGQEQIGSYGTTRRKAKGAGDEGPVALHFTSDAGAYLTTMPRSA